MNNPPYAADDDPLHVFCRRLCKLHDEAGGPKIDALLKNRANGFPLRRSQIYDILSGRIEKTPPWDFVRAFVAECVAYAASHGSDLSVPADLAYWRREHTELTDRVRSRSRPGASAARDRKVVPDESRDSWITPNELPPDVSNFTGRVDELAALDERIRAYLESSTATVITAISGTAGAGKTALAVHWAHLHASKFPDGCLFQDLHGYDPDSPMSPAAALAAMLQRVEADEKSIPLELADSTAKYRTMLHHKRVLIILDNAKDAAQVRPLLPGSASCFVLVTSRDDLAGLVARDGAQRVEMDLLTGEAPPENGDPGYLDRARARRRVRVATAISGTLLLLVMLTALGFLVQHQSRRPPPAPPRAARSSARETTSPSGGTSAPTQNTREWDTLPLAPALGKLAFDSSFSGPVVGWPASSTNLAVNRYAEGGYVLHPLTRRRFDMVAAPSNVMTSVETVTATASLQSGQGIWGVWCRGTDSHATQSYQFWISHAGAVSIVTPQGQTPWVYLQGIDVTTPTTLLARCADANPGPVQLTLSVNGRQVLNQRVSGALLGPGFSGIEAAGFSDVAGPIAQIQFSRYAIYEG